MPIPTGSPLALVCLGPSPRAKCYLGSSDVVESHMCELLHSYGALFLSCPCESAHHEIIGVLSPCFIQILGILRIAPLPPFFLRQVDKDLLHVLYPMLYNFCAYSGVDNCGRKREKPLRTDPERC